MKVLLDTQAFLWWIGNDNRLSQPARAVIAAADNEVFLSVASAWELAVKARIGRLDIPMDLDRFLPAQIQCNAFSVLPIALAHTLALYRLPLHHRDPFDRMLIAQAQCEDMTLVTCDASMRRYEVPIHW
jgi:PIN domain nuclease of toxin-antitoxin system